MLKTLFKKQLLEFASVCFQSKKKGERRTKGATIGMVVLFAFCYLALAASFFGMSMLFQENYLKTGHNGLYFSMLGVIALLVNVIGSIFMTYSVLYQAKDNDFLLSMPIPPRMILLVRMASIYVMGLIFSSCVMLPAMIVYWIFAPVTFVSVVLQFLSLLLIGFLALSISCILGFLIALLVSKIRSKAVFSLLSVALILGIYYICYFKLNKWLEDAAGKAESVEAGFRKYLLPLSLMGEGCTGRILPFLGFAAIALLLFVLVCAVVSSNFTRIVTRSGSAAKKSTQKAVIEASRPEKALIRREYKHFLSSPAYMMNPGLGLILALVLAAALIIKKNDMDVLLSQISAETPGFLSFFPVAGFIAISFILSTAAFSAPSVSLEGKYLWILRSLPVDPKKVLNAKLRMHFELCAVPGLIAAAVFCIVTKISIFAAAAMILSILAYIAFTDTAGLALNLRHPRFDWTSETVVIKQSMPVSITLFGGWLVSIILGVLYFLIAGVLDPAVYLLIIAVLLTVLSALLYRYITNKGVQIFNEL